MALTNLGIVACARRDYQAAREFHRRSLTLAVSVGEERAIAECLEELAAVESAAGRHDRAARLFGAARRIREAVGTPTPAADVGRITAAAAASEVALSHSNFADGLAAGRAMTRAEVVEFAAADLTAPAAVASSG